MNRRKFITSSFLIAISLSVNANNSLWLNDANKDKPINELRLYLIRSLTETDLTLLLEYYEDFLIKEKSLEKLVRLNFIEDETITIKGILFSKAEIANLLYEV